MGEARGKSWDGGGGQGRPGAREPGTLQALLGQPLLPASRSSSGGRPGMGHYRMTGERTRVKWSQTSLAGSGGGMEVPGMRVRGRRRGRAGSQEGLLTAPRPPCPSRHPSGPLTPSAPWGTPRVTRGALAFLQNLRLQHGGSACVTARDGDLRTSTDPDGLRARAPFTEPSATWSPHVHEGLPTKRNDARPASGSVSGVKEALLSCFSVPSGTPPGAQRTPPNTQSTSALHPWRLMGL